MRTTTRVLVTALTSLLLLAGLSVPASAAGTDDYPYRTDTTQSADPWGFTKRQCVSFVAWRMKQAGRPVSYSQGYRSALNWDENAKARGKVLSTTPRVGAVAQWNPGEKSHAYFNGSRTPNGYMTAGQYGHVATVLAVHSDGSATIEQYNGTGSRTYSRLRIKRMSSSTHRYLYL